VIVVGAYSRVLKTKGTRWLYQGQYLNNRYHSQAIYLTKSAALQAEEQKKKEIKEWAYSLNAMYEKLSAYIAVWLQALSKRKCNRYEAVSEDLLIDLLTFFGDDKPIGQITGADFVRFLNHLRKTYNNSHPVANYRIRVYRMFFNHVINFYGVSMKNPCAVIDV
jgi:hypothetical protein